MITHELRNPLHGILGIIELIQNHDLPDSILSECGTALGIGKHMMCLINDLLDISQIEANKFTLTKQRFAVHETVEESLKILRYYNKKSLFLRADSRDEHLVVYNDQRRYSQILINLLSNAIKFTSQGGVSVTYSYDYANQILTTKVSDTGIGISEEGMKKLFGMFQRVGPASQNPTGVGLGLLISKKLSEEMGGNLTVSSSVGIGTTFSFTINDSLDNSPLMKEDTKDHSSSKIMLLNNSCNQEEIEKGTPDQWNILVIDDDLMGRKLIKSFCHHLKCSVEQAESGEEGLEIVQKNIFINPFTHIFVDYHLPKMNGIEFAQASKKLFALSIAPFSIYLISGDSSPELQEECRRVGIQKLISKPFGVKDITSLFPT